MMFQARLSKLAGMAFQNFFTEIMQYADPGFIPVKPQGNLGDWKNDGHNPKMGTYYQVYSPEQFDETAAVKKLKEDFTGLVTKWGDCSVYENGVQEFYFVINDHFRIVPGGYPTTITELEKLRKEHDLKKCELFLAKHLEDILLKLTEDQIISVVGFPPNPADIDVLPFRSVNEVITHIIENTPIRSLNQTLVSPDFDEKITFNNLGVTKSWLTDANYRCGALEDFFNAHSNFTRQEVRNHLRGIYEESLTYSFADGANGGATASDQRLQYILNKITPNPPNKNHRLTKELQDSALVVMAYFFESCDIFEEPQ